MARKSFKLLLLVILIGLIFRAVHYSAISRTAFVDFPEYATETDLYGYWQWSEAIVQGDWLGKNTWHPQFNWMRELGSSEDWARWWGNPQIFQQEPAYPYLVAIGRMVGFSLSGLILIQLLIGSLQGLATFFLARLVFRDDRPALISALVAVLYGPLLFNQGALLRDWTAPLLATVLLVVLLRAANANRPVSWVWPGLVLGLMLMAYSTILLFLPAMVIWLAWINRESLKKMSTRLGVMLTGVVSGFLPLLVRNLYLGVPPFSVSNRFPEAVVSGMAVDSNPLGMNIAESLPGLLEKSRGGTFTALVETLKTHNGDWLGFALLMWEKFRGLADPFEIPNNLSYLYGKEISPVLNYLPDFGWVLPLGVVGMLLVMRSRHLDRAQGLMFLFGGSMFLALMMNLVLGRYRLIVMTFLFIYSGWALWHFWRWIISRQYLQFFTAVAALLVLALIQQFALSVPALRQNDFFMLHPSSYFTASQIYMAKGRLDLSVAECKRMHRRATQFRFYSAADTAIEQEQYVRLQWLFKAHEVGRPDLVEMNLLAIERLFDQRIDQTMRDYTIAMIQFKIGRLQEAKTRLQRFIVEYPNLEAADKAREVILSIEDS